ncbi:MAG: type II toxin-antitoxin system VapC family toxin [Dehalococcoidia bacterium]
MRADDSAAAQQDLTTFVETAPILPVTQAIAERCAQLRQTLRDKAKRPERRGFDLVIAATALEHNLTLVTRNVRDYEDIPGLTIL